MSVIISCEHASYNIPTDYQYLFKGQQRVLASHRGWDPGASELATRIARKLKVPCHKGKVSRLLIDLNRSPHNRQRFSAYTNALDKQTKSAIIARYYQPYRDRIVQQVARLAAQQKPVVHFSMHSFTPVLNGNKRNADIGLLYDPGRRREKALAKLLGRTLSEQFPGTRIRYNYPYRGTADGMTSYLRKHFSASTYLGIEIEVNQQHIIGKDKLWRDLKSGLGNYIGNTLSKIHQSN